MAEFEQIESSQTTGGGEPPVKSLYNSLVKDKEYGSIFSTYTPEEFESNIKSNKDAANSLRQIAVSKGFYKTDKDFDAAIFAVKPAAPVEAKKPKEEKGWIRTALTEGIPGVAAKLATTPMGQSLGQTFKQTEDITGEPVKKKEGTGISYGEYKRTPLDDYEQIQQEYVQADKAYQGAKSEANRTPRELALGLTPTTVSPEIIRVRDDKRRKSDAILAKSQPEIETWVESIIGDKDKGIPSKVSLSLDLKEKTTLPRGLYRNNAGNITVDDAVTDKFAKEEVRRRGLPENGVVYKLLKNSLDRRLPFELARPEIEREAERNFFKENGISITDAKAKDFAKQMGGTESEQRALNERTAKLGEQIFSERDAKINEINQNLKSLQEADKKRMESDEEGMAAYNAVRDNLVAKYQDLVNKGEISAEQANAYLNSDQVNEAANRARNEVLQKKYGAKMKSDYDKYLSSFGNTNSRYKARYEREAKEAEVIANAQLDRRVAEMKLKYKPSDAFIGKYRKAYESSAKKYSDTKMSQELAREVGADAVDRITRSVMSSLGDGVRGLGQFFNMPDAEQFGEVLSSNFKGANIKLKPGAEGWKQALNPFDPAAQQSFGQLLGRMTPALATSAAVGAATGGLGFSTLGSAISAGFAGGLMETADIAGTIYNDVLEQTGSEAKATIAANAAIKSQIQNAPVYALDAFAYFPKLFRGLKYGKSVLGRSMYGAGTEYITEMLQELPQNVYEELIRKGVDDDRPYDPSIGSMLANINMERISETGKQLTGTILMGGAPSLFKDTGEGISKQLAKRAAQAYYAKNIITNASHPALILENQSQFLQKAFDNKGKNFANAMIGTFLINGNLNKEQAQALTVSMDNYEAFNKMLAQQKREDINPLAKQALFTLYNKWMTARASKNEEATQKALADFQKLYTGGGADLLLVRLADGSTNVYTYDDFDTLLDNEKMQELVRQQGFEITPFSQTPNDPQVAAMNQRLQEIVENGPQAAVEREDSGFTSPDDEKILEGQKRTGFQVVSPLTNLPEEIQAALQAATDNQEGFDPQAIRDASNYLYRLYNITTNLKKSSTRNLTKSQIADQMEELGTALDLLGNYYNRLATGEMDIQEEVEQQDGTAQAEQPQAPGTQRPPLPGTPQVNVLTDDEILARMTEEERDAYYDYILKGDKDSAQAMVRGMRNEILGAEQQMDEVRDAAAMVQKALEESGVEVTMVDNPEEFDKLIRENGGSGQAAAQGMFFAPSGKIFINRSLLRGKDAKVVVWHEGTHPVMNIIRNTNPELYDKVVTGLKKASIKNKEIARIILDAKRGDVDPARQDDEAIVETIGQIADGSILLSDIPTTLRDALVEFINKIAAVFGLPQIKVSDVVAFKKLAADISAVLKGDKKLEEVVGKGNIKEYQDLIGQVESRGQARKATPAFSQLDSALALSPVKSKEARSELIDEYGKETIDQMIEITRNFEKIINGLEEQEVVTKDCP
jgi:hypothetical protein